MSAIWYSMRLRETREKESGVQPARLRVRALFPSGLLPGLIDAPISVKTLSTQTTVTS